MNEAIKFYDDYSLMMSEAKTKSKQNNTTAGTGLKILTPKQRFFNDASTITYTLAHVKAATT